MTEAKTIVTQLLLLAGIVLGTNAARRALAADRAPSVPAGAGLQSNHIGGFDRPLDRGPVMLPPVFNQSNPYTMPQSAERPVSPTSPGSVFGDH